MLADPAIHKQAILHHSENKSCGKSRIYYNNEDSIANFL